MCMKFIAISILTISFVLLFRPLMDGQEVRVYKHFDDFEHLLHYNNDTIYVINFWATWCKPCVEELPYFQQLNRKFKDKKFKMILVSLDFEKNIDSKVKPFIRDRDLQAKVVLLADPSQYEWIDRVNKDWSGSIPITIIYNNDYYFFKEGSINFDSLNEIIIKNIQQ